MSLGMSPRPLVPRPVPSCAAQPSQSLFSSVVCSDCLCACLGCAVDPRLSCLAKGLWLPFLLLLLMVSGGGRAVAFERLGSSVIPPWLYHRPGTERHSWNRKLGTRPERREQRLGTGTKTKSEEAKTCTRARQEAAPPGQKFPKSPGIVTQAYNPSLGSS